MDQLFFPEDHPERYKGPPLPRALKVLLQLSEGLSYIHSQGLVHRDIKPANVLISCTGAEPITLKWADFGLSKETDECGNYEMSGYRGTLYWMAPELISYLNNRLIPKCFTASTDVFPLGCLFFKYFTGCHPFGNNILTDVPQNIQLNNPVNFLDESKYTLRAANRRIFLT